MKYYHLQLASNGIGTLQRLRYYSQWKQRDDEGRGGKAVKLRGCYEGTVMVSSIIVHTEVPSLACTLSAASTTLISLHHLHTSLL